MRVASGSFVVCGFGSGELQVVGIGNVVVLGCYRSGSSLLAGMLHCLGVNLGPSFWGDFYEAADLSAELRRWWDEPRLNPMVPQVQRIEYLRQWQQRQANQASLGGGEVPSVGTMHLSVELCIRQRGQYIRQSGQDILQMGQHILRQLDNSSVSRNW